MHGKNKTICIAGKNDCAIKALSYVIKKYKKYKILALPNKTDNGVDNWQKSFKKFAKRKKVEIASLNSLYRRKDLYLFSLEYENILPVKKFISKNLYNLHFSLLPKYRGCHTNYLQIAKGEKKSGVTLHEIDNGIDTGRIIDKIDFYIPLNSTGYDNYKTLLKKSVLLFKKNVSKIINGNYSSKKQNLKAGSYFNRKSINYKKIVHLKLIRHNKITHNKIRALIFDPYQLPIYNGKKIKKSIFKDKKIKLFYLK